MLKGNNSIALVAGIADGQKQRINDFLQGAVYAWCNAQGTAPFVFADLMGGNNAYWQYTPLVALYAYHKSLGKDDVSAEEDAAKDAGMLLKSVLVHDKNKSFNQAKQTAVNGISRNKYCLIS